MAEPHRIKGVLTPVLTPIKADYSPDPARLIRHCQWILAQDCGLAVFGTNSEANSFAVNERMAVLEALVGCDLAMKLRYGDAAARYDGRTDPHPHAHCRVCGAVRDVSGPTAAPALESLGGVDGFVVEGYRLEVLGRCAGCA